MPTDPCHAAGQFDVTLQPQTPSEQAVLGSLARMSILKRFHGDLDAESHGEMLAYGNPKSGFAGYVALEQVTGTLHGRSGRFALQHSSTLNAGQPTQSISVVPGSGTEQLAGLAGALVIDIRADGSHHYRFDYTLPTPG